jgi:hypothetical protein
MSITRRLYLKAGVIALVTCGQLVKARTEASLVLNLVRCDKDHVYEHTRTR